MSAAAAEKVPGTVADTAPDSTDDATVAVSEVAKDLATEEALKELFQGADAVADSALDGYYTIRDMPAFEKWITDRKSTLCNPALAQDTPKQKYLVLDLDNTLICRDSYSSDSFRVSGTSPSTYNIQLHPDCLTFLHEMSAHYHQLVIFTSSSYVYALNVVKEITKRYQKAFQDSTEPFSLVLASHNCTIYRGERRKDLDAFGSLSDVVFVDDDPYYSMEGQNDNVIQVRRYHGDESEEPGLMAIAPLLTYLSSVKDVSQSMRDFKKVWHKAGLVKVVPSTVGITC
jgi:hypothetical protein